MAQRPSMVPLIVVGGVALAALLGFNFIQSNSDPAIVAEKQKEAEREASKAAAKNAPKGGERPAAPPVAGADELVTWGAKKTFGTASGKPAITVTWEWTPTVQGNPSAVFSAVETLKRAVPSAAITVVNRDTTGGNAPLGITVDGAMRLPALADGTFPPEPAIVGAIQAGTPK